MDRFPIVAVTCVNCFRIMPAKNGGVVPDGWVEEVNEGGKPSFRCCAPRE